MSLRSIVKRASLATDPLLARQPGVTVLIYHRVGGGSSSEVDLDVHTFRQHLEHLAEHTNVVSLTDAVALLDDPASGDTGSTGRPTPPVTVITFDDGTADFTDHAVPALVEAGLPATLYVATEFVDGGHDFPWGAPPTSWAALRDATSTGLVTIGSHTHSHWLMDRTDPGVVAADLDESIQLITAHIGTAPTHFAYPKAVLGSPATEIAVRRRFTTAALARSRTNVPGHTDLHRLSRTPVQRSDTARHFAAKARGGMRLEGLLRDTIARAKYAGATR